MKVIAGLGNPGKEYENTKHNVGFRVIDKIAEDNNISVNKLKFKAFIGEGTINGEKVMLVKPQTFMNLSGESIKQILTFYKVPAKDFFVIYDDTSLPLNAIRIRQKGSAGGHNGLTNINELLGTQDYARIRMGIGNDFGRGQQVGYVLGELSEEETEQMPEICKRVIEGIKAWATIGADRAMNVVNTRPKTENKA